jgi:hypothetical protein
VGDHCLMSEGWFWSAGDEAHVRGEFTSEAGRDAEVTLAGAVAEDPRVTVKHTATGETIMDVSGDPAEHVAAFAPMDLHGQPDSGELVSLLSSQNYGVPGPFAPRYVARVAVFGAHVSDGQLYSAVRFRIDHPYWTAHLADGEAHAVPDDGSVLRAVAPEEGTDKGTWLVYESAQPRSYHSLNWVARLHAWHESSWRPHRGLSLAGPHAT